MEDENHPLNIGGLLSEAQSSKTMLLIPQSNNWSVGILSIDVWDEKKILDLDTALGTESEDRGRIHRCNLYFDNQKDNQMVLNHLGTFRKVWDLAEIISLSYFFDGEFGPETEVAGGRGPNSDPETVWNSFVAELHHHIQLTQ